MSGRPSVWLTVSEGVGVLTFDPTGDAVDLAEALRSTLARAWREGALRVETEITATDLVSRRALHIAGFRREGRRRGISSIAGADSLLYAVMDDDVIDGLHGFSAVMDSVLPTKRVIGHAIARNRRGQILLLETVYKPDWELPGGVIEPGESPSVGTQREIREELGIHVDLGQPALIDWMPPYLGWSDAIEFLFDLGTLDADLIATMRSDAEIRAYHWVEPHDVARLVTDLSARRIELVLAGHSGYSEAGYLV